MPENQHAVDCSRGPWMASWPAQDSTHALIHACAAPAPAAAAAADFIQMGNMGAAEVESADAFVLIAPQNIIGHSIMPLLSGAQVQAGWRAASQEGRRRREGQEPEGVTLSFLSYMQLPCQNRQSAHLCLPRLLTHACCSIFLQTPIGCLPGCCRDDHCC
jgi:hypothetical protein